MAKFLFFWNSGNYQIIFLLKITKSHLIFLPIKFHSDALSLLQFLPNFLNRTYTVHLKRKVMFAINEYLGNNFRTKKKFFFLQQGFNGGSVTFLSFLFFFFTQIAHTNIFKFYVFYRKKNSWYQSFLLFIFYQSESQVLMSFHQNVWNEKSPVLDLRVAYQ